MKPTIILASASPQRKELLASIDLPFEVHPSSVEETEHPEQSPVERAQQLAALKARDVAARFPGSFIIGCDTLVVAADGTLLEKPKDAAEARMMLEMQNGKISLVHSGTCVINPSGTVFEGMSSSKVRFKHLSSAEKDWWIASRLWEGKSGGFQNDGPGALLIEQTEGDWSGIVGLPLFLLGQLLTEAGYPLYA